MVTLKIFLLSLSLLSWVPGPLVQRRQTKKPPRVRVAPLHRVGEYPNQYVPGTFKIPNVVLEDVRRLENDVIHVLQLYDPKTKFRHGERGKNATFNTYDFLTCTREDLGQALIERKEKWFNRRVNVYLIMQDVGLTVFHYVGYIKKIELLDEKGAVVETLTTSL
jgi:hypothetical protein